MSTATASEFASLVETDSTLFELQSRAAGPAGSLPLTEELLRNAPSGELFGLSQDVGMGWNPAELAPSPFPLSPAGEGDLPGVLVPGGVMLAATVGEDTAKVQTIGARFAHGQISLAEAAEAGCRACASPGGGCQFLGTAATSQVVGEALGLTLPHAALSPSGQPIWLDMARRSAKALTNLASRGITVRHILTDAAIRNAMTVHAAFGGSTNLILHIPAIAYSARLRRPTVDDWIAINRRVPRLVDVLPNGPIGHPTVRVFLAGGVPEVMLHLRRLGLLDESALTVTGEPLGRLLDWWERSERRQRLRDVLRDKDGVDPDEVVMSPERARTRGLTSTVTFPRGNL